MLYYPIDSIVHPHSLLDRWEILQQKTHDNWKQQPRQSGTVATDGDENSWKYITSIQW